MKKVTLENNIVWSHYDGADLDEKEIRWFFCYEGEDDYITVSRIYEVINNQKAGLGAVQINWYGTGASISDAKKFSLLLKTAIEKAGEEI